MARWGTSTNKQTNREEGPGSKVASIQGPGSKVASIQGLGSKLASIQGPGSKGARIEGPGSKVASIQGPGSKVAWTEGGGSAGVDCCCCLFLQCQFYGVRVETLFETRARHGHCRIDRQDLIEPSRHSREDSILPSILHGRRMSVSSPPLDPL
eukprot:445437-Prorocentrum_minimum.AAC.1